MWGRDQKTGRGRKRKSSVDGGTCGNPTKGAAGGVKEKSRKCSTTKSVMRPPRRKEFPTYLKT